MPTPYAGYAIDSLASLKYLTLAERYPGFDVGYSRLVRDKKSWYTYYHTDTTTPDDDEVVTPLDGVGRWIKHTRLVSHTHSIYLTEPQADARYSLIGHDHDIWYSPIDHNHTGVYSPVDHNHTGVYSPVSHNHDGVYALFSHSHPYLDQATADTRYLQIGDYQSHTNYTTLNKLGESGGRLTFDGVNLGLTRSSTTVTASDLASNTHSYQSVTMGKSAVILKVGVNYPARIRAYHSAAARLADVNRSTSTSPVSTGYNSHGCLMDVTIGASPNFIWLAPVATVYNQQEVGDGNLIYFTVTNLDTVTRSTEVNLTYITLES